MKRSVDEDSYSNNHLLHLSTSSSLNNGSSLPDQQCRSEVWRCMSNIMEDGVKHITKPMDMIGSVYFIALVGLWCFSLSAPHRRCCTRQCSMGGCRACGAGWWRSPRPGKWGSVSPPMTCVWSIKCWLLMLTTTMKVNNLKQYKMFSKIYCE